MHFPCSDTWLEGLLADDCPGLDLTVELLGIAAASGVMRFAPKADCTISGVEEAELLLRKCGLSVSRTAANSDRLAAGQQCLEATGPAAALHRGWKLAQTLMEYMTGIATRAAHMVEQAHTANPAVRVAVTRKNFPGAKIQCLEAALSGGAVVHRLHLSDSVLFFDQHRIFLDGAEGSAEKALREFAKRVPELQKRLPERKLCAEIDTPEEAVILAEAGLDIIQCEKFSCDDLRRTVEKIKAVNPRIVVVAAGGVNGDNVESYAATGVDSLVTSWVYFGKPADIKVVVEREE